MHPKRTEQTADLPGFTERGASGSLEFAKKGLLMDERKPEPMAFSLFPFAQSVWEGRRPCQHAGYVAEIAETQDYGFTVSITTAWEATSAV